MRYLSTRGQAEALDFEGVMLAGLASDGGLYVPESLPEYSTAQLRELAKLAYPELARRIMSPFVAGTIPEAEFAHMVDAAYAPFRHKSVTPLLQLGHNEWLLELFHGPTLAFKDVALQLLGQMLDFVLQRRDQRVVILGATSGDTGSAAIEGCRQCERVDIFILHPHQRVSDVQRRQMTTVPDKHVYNIAIEGNFDDCQAIVKQSFGEQEFLPDDRQLVAVNSINWARIMAQVVYYFYAAFHLGAPERAVSFSVPTGNFGDIFAGYLAKRMGLPIEKLVIATNQNDILHRMLSNNDYSRQPLEQTLSPSMDIMISSNFERMLFDLYDRDASTIAAMMADFNTQGISLSADAMGRARELFASARVDDEQTTALIAEVFREFNYVLDPHSAIGLYAARQYQSASTPMVTLATAHPAKFPDAIQRAGLETAVKLPAQIEQSLQREERYKVLANDCEAVQHYIRASISAAACTP